MNATAPELDLTLDAHITSAYTPSFVYLPRVNLRAKNRSPRTGFFSIMFAIFAKSSRESSTSEAWRFSKVRSLFRLFIISIL